jgi:hypothetical protein
VGGLPGRKRVAAQLRRQLGVADESPLRFRTARDHLEHFDERLETWAETSPQRNLLDANIGSTGPLPAVRAEDWMRHLEDTEMSFIFQAERYPLRPLVAAIQELAPRAERLGSTSRPPTTGP